MSLVELFPENGTIILHKIQLMLHISDNNDTHWGILSKNIESVHKAISYWNQK